MLHLHKTHHQKGLLLSLTKNRLTLFIATALFAVTSFYIPSLALAEHHDVFNLNAMTFQSRSDRHESMGSEGSPYAYVFMAFHCFPEREGQSTYRAYIANILASAKLLRKHGSKADIVAFFMMHIDSNSMQLPAEEEEMLYLMGVQIRYLPKATDWQGSTSWKVSTLNKVHLLNMTEYRRVLFLDGDAMPSTNLDYMFYLSEGEDAILKETVIISTRRSPMWAGFFLTTPNSTAYKILLEEIRHVAVKKFDKYWGWGATTIIEPDYWASNDPKIRGQNWTWVRLLLLFNMRIPCCDISPPFFFDHCVSLVPTLTKECSTTMRNTCKKA